jgi:hypothetical protein
MDREEVIKGLAKLREPFPDHQISIKCQPYKKDSPKGKCAKCGGYHGLPAVALSYVGHAALTDRLLDVDPLWSWEPLALDANHLPLIDPNGGLWIKLTVLGITRLGYGDAEGKTGPNAMKERIGDALRNAAMRFGAALDLWHKGDLHLDEETDPKSGEGEKAQVESEQAPGSAEVIQGVKQWSIEDQERFVVLMDRLYVAFKTAGKLDKHPDEANKWRARMSQDPASKVLANLQTHVGKLEKAAGIEPATTAA